MRSIVKTQLYMDPVEFDDGHGYRTIVEMSDGRHALISEIHRDTAYSKINETMVFECDNSGKVLNYTDLYCVPSGTTLDAIGCADLWQDPW